MPNYFNKEKLPSFTEEVVPPSKIRQMVAALERRLQSIEDYILGIDTTGGGGGVTMAQVMARVIGGL